MAEWFYAFILKNGWNAWFFPYVCRIQKPPFENPNQIFETFGYMGQVGHHSFRGDVPATMLAYGTPGEVSEYCERLITEIGMKTPGFMLGTGCEVPLNCKPENYAALMQSLPRYAR